MKIGILGTGNMARVLAPLWAGNDHMIKLGSRTPDQVRGRYKGLSNITVVTYQEAVDFGEILVIATPWSVTSSALAPLHGMQGKTVLDVTNPLSADASHLLVGGQTSAAETIAALLPDTNVVKAFNGINAVNLDQPQFSGETVQVFYCGDDDASKNKVAVLIRDLGFEAVDCGSLSNARYLEAMAMLWIQLAFVEDQGTGFSFKLVKKSKKA